MLGIELIHCGLWYGIGFRYEMSRVTSRSFSCPVTSRSFFFAAVPLSHVLHADRIRKDGHVSVDVHRGPRAAPHDVRRLLAGTRGPDQVLHLGMG